MTKSDQSYKLKEAEKLVYQAWECKHIERILLAQKALKLSPDCADAYLILAEETTNAVSEKCALYKQAFEAGERALGHSTFVTEAGSFWGVTRTRPYMRARFGYARCLEQLGRRWEALRHYAEMLLLNPGDNQGVRYYLASGLLAEGDFMSFERYFGREPDEQTALWLYPKALWLFQRHGELRRSTIALRKAFAQNRHVPNYLLGTKKIPARLPESYVHGRQDEAMVYAELGKEAWENTENALAWLAKQADKIDTL